jgi:hypothetical protein
MIKSSPFSFRISDKAVDEAFKEYLRRKVQKRTKFYAVIVIMALVFYALDLGVNLFLLFNCVGSISSLIAVWVTARHLWTVDYFFLFSSIHLAVGMAFKYYLQEQDQD